MININKFIKKVLVFSIIPVLSLIGICFLADGYTDPYYLRFTTPKQQNLILGTSRAAQGIQPAVFKSILNKEISNFAFTVTHSPYGSVYYEAIKRKHNKKNGGIFILAVDPWSITSWNETPNDTKLFRENELCLAKTKTMDAKPNFEYLYKNLKGHYNDVLLPPSHSVQLHNDGWLEIKDIAMDSLTVANRTREKVKSYRKTKLKVAKLSKKRLEFLIKTIAYLKDYGHVYLVRLPVGNDIMKIENELMPDFDQVIHEAVENSFGYFDLTEFNTDFLYTDGNHLYKKSGEEVSKLIADWIKKHEK